ncbi:MAG: D-amino-acid transaminase [Alphaproteobacteria bacterium]
MSRIAYVNGRYVPLADAGVHIEDRGMQFADAVYEVVAVVDGELADLDAHLDRLAYSLREVRIENAPGTASLQVAMRQTVRRNRVKWGLLYLQIGRGVARRDHAFPAEGPASVVMTCRAYDYGALAAKLRDGVAIATVPDERWARPDIKSTSLLANVLAKQAARDKGAFEAWMVDDDGFITEGSSTTAWIVTDGETLVTRPLSRAILPGITRAVAEELARADNLTVEERAFTVEEAKGAKEAFLTSTSGGPVPVVEIDGETVGNGMPGLVTGRLAALYRMHLASYSKDPAAALKVLSGE